MLLEAFFIGIILGITFHPIEIFSRFVLNLVALGMGICGFIALFVVPIELYFEDWVSRKRNRRNTNYG
jgi:uncharacterized membrane protein YgaE (UPF0421/DUF939 family)